MSNNLIETIGETLDGKRIVKVDGKYFSIDMSMLKQFAKMEMTVVPPPMPSPQVQVRTMMDCAPVVRVPSVVMLADCGPVPEWSFAYLFPLGKRAYTRKGKR